MNKPFFDKSERKYLNDDWDYPEHSFDDEEEEDVDDRCDFEKDPSRANGDFFNLRY